MHSSPTFFSLYIFLTLTLLVSSQLIFDPERTTNLRFTYNFRDPSTHVAVILTTAEDRVSGAFEYDPTSQVRTPRILASVSVRTLNVTSGLATVPPLQLPEPVTNISVYYFRMYDTGDTIYTIAGSLTLKTADFPPVGEALDGLLYMPSDLPDRTEYQTLFYTTMIKHDAEEQLSCQYQIQYTGIIRSVFFNDDRMGQWGVEEDDIYSYQTATGGPVKLKPEELTVLTVIGYRLNLDDFQILNCSKDNVVPQEFVNVNISYFSPGDSISKPQKIQFINQTSVCESSATRCINGTESLKCASGFYRASSHCQEICPADQPTVTLLGECSASSYQQIRQGYRDTELGIDSENKTMFDYFLDAPTGSTILTIFWPSEDQVITPVPLWFAKGDYLLSRAVFTLHDLDDSGLINYSVLLKLDPSVLSSEKTVDKQIRYSHYEIITDPLQTIMVVNYTQEPLTEADMMYPTSLSYVPLNQEIFLNSNSFIYMTTYLNCLDACNVSVRANGIVEGTQDFRTFLFKLDFGSKAWVYSLPETLTGIVALTFKVQGSSIFQLTVNGTSYTAFSHRFPLTMQNFTPFAVIDELNVNLSPGCLNGEDGLCHSCQEGYFLNLETSQCDMTCPQGFLGYTPERKCFEKTCGPNTVLLGDTCVPKCEKEGDIYIEGIGCGGTCLKGCKSCSNSTGVCLDCAYRDPASFVSECSYCPPGSSFDTETNGCKSYSQISIMGPNQISVCSDLLLTVSINPVEELYLCPLNYTWTVNSTASNINSRSLASYLTSQNLKELIVPSRYLTMGANYTFTVQYKNALSVTVSANITVSVVSNAYPPINIDGGGNKIFYYYDTNILKARILYSESCFPLTRSVEALWKQTGGPQIDLTTDSNPNASPFWLTIPKCRLQPGSSYEFELDVWKTDTPTKVATATTQFRVPPLNFTLDILNGNRQVPTATDLVLQTRLNYRIGDCPFVEDNITVTYQWTCEIKTSDSASSLYRPCDDPNNLFGVPINDTSLTIPSSYFRQGDSLRVTVKAVKDKDSTSTYVVLDVTSVDTLPLTMECTNCQLGCNYDSMLFKADIPDSRARGKQVGYSWGVTPTLVTNSYKSQFKIVKDSQILGTGPLLVQLQAQIKGKSSSDTASRFLADSSSKTSQDSVASSLRILVNSAPQGGSLDISPKTGDSLSTYFHITAINWQDEDAPLSYEFFYFYEGSQEYRLTDQQRYPYIYTMLPGNASTNSINIRVIVRDSLGAVASAVSTVEVNARGKDIIDALLIYKQDFGDITKEGDPSIANAEPYEMLKTLSLMGRELSSYEQLNVDYTEPNFSVKKKNQVMNFKMALIHNIQSVHDSISNDDTNEVLIESVSALTSNADFNFPPSVVMITGAMQSSLANKMVLSSPDISNAAQIIANVLANFGAGTYTTDEAKQLRDFTGTWLDRISQNVLADKIPDEAPTRIQTLNFDTYIAQTSGCEILNMSVKTSSNAPEFFLYAKDGYANDVAFSCDNVYNVIYYAFDPNLPSPQNLSSLVNSQKSLIALTITDQNSQPVSLPVAYLIRDSNYCPESCNIVPDGLGTCQCFDASTFSQNYVLDRIFGLLPKQFNIWIIVPFQVLLVSAIWLVVTLILVRYIMPKYCKVASFIALAKKTRLRAILTVMLVTPKLLNIYTYFDKNMPKTRRALLYFVRIQLFTVLACILATSAKYTGIDEVLMQKIGANAFILVFAIPYVTIYPVSALLEKMTRNYKSNKVDTLRRLRSRQMSQVYNRSRTICDAEEPQNSKCVYMLGVFLALILVAASQAYTWLVSLKDITVERRVTWLTYTVLALILDLTLTPLILNMLNYIGSAIWASNCVQSSSILKGMFEAIIDKKILAIRIALDSKRKIVAVTEGEVVEEEKLGEKVQGPADVQTNAIPLDRQMQPDTVPVNTDALDYRNVKKR